MKTDRIPLALVPFLIAGVVLSIWVPLRIFGSWWVGLVAGAVVGIVAIWAIVPVARRSAADDLRLAGGLLAAYAALTLAANTWWPIFLLIPAVAGIIRWRAVRVQTGHRQPR